MQFSNCHNAEVIGSGAHLDVEGADEILDIYSECGRGVEGLNMTHAGCEKCEGTGTAWYLDANNGAGDMADEPCPNCCEGNTHEDEREI